MKLFGTVYAHCDIPCGIYETDTMSHAARTCTTMCHKISELSDLSDPDNLQHFTRMVNVKEKHAERVKREVTILWGDYFKSEHLGLHDNLHDLIWRTLKQASVVKQGLSEEEATKLEAMVAEVAEVFAKSKR